MNGGFTMKVVEWDRKENINKILIDILEIDPKFSFDKEKNKKLLKEFHLEINEDFLAKHSDEEMIDMPKVVYETDHTAIENHEFFVIHFAPISAQTAKNSSFIIYSYIILLYLRFNITSSSV